MVGDLVEGRLKEKIKGNIEEKAQEDTEDDMAKGTGRRMMNDMEGDRMELSGNNREDQGKAEDTLALSFGSGELMFPPATARNERTRGSSKKEFFKSSGSESAEKSLPPKFLTQELCTKLTIGSIVTLPPKERRRRQLFMDDRLEDKAYLHPAIILGRIPDSDYGVYFGTCTSFSGYTPESIKYFQGDSKLVEEHICVSSGSMKYLKDPKGVFKKGADVADENDLLFPRKTWLRLIPLGCDARGLATVGWLDHEIREICLDTMTEVMEEMKEYYTKQGPLPRIVHNILDHWDKERQNRKFVESWDLGDHSTIMLEENPYPRQMKQIKNMNSLPKSPLSQNNISHSDVNRPYRTQNPVQNEEDRELPSNSKRNEPMSTPPSTQSSNASGHSLSRLRTTSSFQHTQGVSDNNQPPFSPTRPLLSDLKEKERSKVTNDIDADDNQHSTPELKEGKITSLYIPWHRRKTGIAQMPQRSLSFRKDHSGLSELRGRSSSWTPYSFAEVMKSGSKWR